MRHEKGWFKDLVIYQIYPRSFMDANGDGIGDIQGMTQKLDYLQSLGVNAVWMSPVYASPNVDNGYDISDYCSIMEEFGTMEDWEEFRDQAHKRGIAVIMDLVLNHTSDRHPWFQESKKSRDNAYSDYYVWRDPSPEGKEPNGWQSVFGGSAWEYVPERGQYYLHFFAKEQPDLNWENEKAKADIMDVIRFWNEKGVDGYRIDAISYLDKGLDGRADMTQVFGTAACANLEGTHRQIRSMIGQMMEPDQLMTVGEVIGDTTEDLWNYTSASRGEFNMAIPFVAPVVELETWSPERLKERLAAEYEALKEDGWWARFFSNHDKPRQVSLYGDDGKYWKQSAKMLAALLHTLPGTPFIYQGEEIGMTNIRFDSIEEYDDIDTRNYYQEQLRSGVSAKEALRRAGNISRDNARTPMQWEDAPNGGFTKGEPWLAVNQNFCRINVAAQEQDAGSILNFYRRLTGLRKENPIMAHGDFKLVSPAEGPVVAYERCLGEKKWIVIHNFSSQPASFTYRGLDKGEVLLCSWEAEEPLSEELALRPYESLIVEMA